MDRVLILDNGAHSIKALHPTKGAQANVCRNAVCASKVAKRNYIGSQLELCPDYSNLFFRLPFEKGILNNWETQKTVWDHLFSEDALYIDTASTQLVVTEPVFNLPNVQDAYDQIIFEEYNFASCLRAPGPALVPYGHASTSAAPLAKRSPECVLVVDSGYSFTHVVPVLRGAIISSGVRRIDIGGKLLTNHLKELISFRQLYMMDQTSVSEKAKQDCCYVSLDWNEDIEIANTSEGNTIVQTYVLPDFVPTSSNKLGYVRPPPTGLTPPPPSPSPPPDVDPEFVEPMTKRGKGKGKEKEVEEEQTLHMSNERFTVPEVIFNPSTIGMDQAGLCETIAHSIASLPEELRGLFWSNIVCAGGSAGFPGFTERLRRDLRSLAPEVFTVDVRIDSSPTTSTVFAAADALRENKKLRDAFVSREEYLEVGSHATRRKFGRLYMSDLAVQDAIHNA